MLSLPTANTRNYAQLLHQNFRIFPSQKQTAVSQKSVQFLGVQLMFFCHKNLISVKWSLRHLFPIMPQQYLISDQCGVRSFSVGRCKRNPRFSETFSSNFLERVIQIFYSILKCLIQNYPPGCHNHFNHAVQSCYNMWLSIRKSGIPLFFFNTRGLNQKKKFYTIQRMCADTSIPQEGHSIGYIF